MEMTREDILNILFLALAEHHSGNIAEAIAIVDAQLAALEAKGVRLVPAIPTWPMIKTSQCSVEAYDKMIAASPYAPPGS